MTDFSLSVQRLAREVARKANGGACTMLIAARFAALSAWSAVGCGGGGGPGATRVSGIGPVFMHVLKVSARTSAAIRCAFYSCHVGRRSFLQLEVLGACGPLWTSLRAWRSRHAVSGSLRVGSRLQAFHARLRPAQHASCVAPAACSCAARRDGRQSGLAGPTGDSGPGADIWDKENQDCVHCTGF